MRAICFDLDDTLYPYEQYVRSGFRAAAEALAAAEGFDPDAVYEDVLAAYEAGYRTETFDRVLERWGCSTDRVPELVGAFHERVGPLEPYPGVYDLIDALGERYRLGVITDGKNGREKLAELGLDSAFESVWVSPERGIDKRDPRPFEATLSDLGVGPGEAAYVGDHPTVDVAVPNELGMRTVRVRQGRYADDPSDPAADVELDSIGDLPDAIVEAPGRAADVDDPLGDVESGRTA